MVREGLRRLSRANPQRGYSDGDSSTGSRAVPGLLRFGWVVRVGRPAVVADVGQVPSRQRRNRTEGLGVHGPRLLCQTCHVPLPPRREAEVA